MLRVDDIDPPRERPGAREAILRTLEHHGFRPDGPVRYQSARLGLYRDALTRLATDGHLYRCRCTRRALRGLARYPGTCRDRRPRPRRGARARRPSARDPGGRAAGCAWTRRSASTISCRVRSTSAPDDPVLRRRDGLVAYPLASAVDDADVARVVRGADLLDASAAQIAVLERLGPPASDRPPEWAHVPVAVDGDGVKLGKSTGAPARGHPRPR